MNISALADPGRDADRSAPLCVLKFGSSVLATDDDYAKAALEVYRHVRDGEKVIAVVSAVGGHTDQLLALGNRHGGSAASDALLARLARIGELQSAAVMSLALQSIGISAEPLDPHEIDLLADGPALDSDLLHVDARAIHDRLLSSDVVVIPGFIAAHCDHGVATLGRGGTDLSAVFIAAHLGAGRVRLIKDVDGVYAEDPAVNPRSERFSQLSFGAAEKASKGLIQVKAIREAKADGLIIEVASLGASSGTEIGDLRARKGHSTHSRPLRVSLLGCGAVGEGVLAHLRQRPDLFDVGPILVRRPEQHGAGFTSDPRAALDFRPDILVELIGGTDLASDLMQTALLRGVHVITANKAAVSADWDSLHACADRGSAKLRFSAAVGGGAPIIEAIRRLKGRVVAIEGVMNGTCNYLLGRVSEGLLIEEALKEARAAGFAEADPSADVDGDDVAAKLSILVREAFGIALVSRRIPKQGMATLTPEIFRAGSGRDGTVKQVGHCRLLEDGSVEAHVRLVSLSLEHPLARVNGEQNCFLITLDNGEVRRISGKGAGRWPTAAAVFADIMDAQRAFCSTDAILDGARSA